MRRPVRAELLALAAGAALGTALLAGGCPGDIITNPLGVPVIVNFRPTSGYEGTLVTIEGAGFAPARLGNHVRIGGVDAIVVEASAIRLDVLVGIGAQTGPVEVEVGGNATQTETNFALADWPAAGDGADGPPMIFAGTGTGAGAGSGTGGGAGDGLAATGVVRVLVTPAYPTDRVPANLAQERQDIADAWDNVHTFYDQASFGALDVQVTVADWVPLTGTFADYVKTAGEWWAPNLDPAALPRFRAECVNHAVNTQGLDIDDFDALANYIWVNGQFLRAWGGVKKSNFAYTGNGLNINITADHDLWLVALGETANWGRCAHELGHCLVDSPHEAFVLGEDVYDSDLVDPSSATAQDFELMGDHDRRPLFSGYYLDQLGWLEADNIVALDWDRNPFQAQYQLAAHGLTQDADAGRYHLLRIRVTDGLYFYVEVRQQPPAGSAQIFDANIPVAGALHNGGVVVTKVHVDEINNNQQMRFITLLHDENVLNVGQTATEPARALQITVVDEHLEPDGRMVCTVDVAWAQELDPDPDADFDLSIEPFGPGCESLDIWVDRQPWGTFDHTDSAGNPAGNGDQPQPNAINHFWARVHCNGGTDAANVRLAYYAITPPGVGDNGNWSPLPDSPVNFAALAAGGTDSDYVNWVPEVGEHTCLQVIVEHQLGESSYGNNRAQENVFEFEAPAASPPDPVRIPFAVRNPQDQPRFVEVTLHNVPSGFLVQVPHQWVYLEGLGEKRMEAIVVPLWDIQDTRYRQFKLDLKIAGWIPWAYAEPLHEVPPASKFMRIGGLVAQVRPKHRGTLEIREDRNSKSTTAIGILGTLAPALAGQPVLVRLVDPAGAELVRQATTAASGAFSTTFELTAPAAGQYKARAYIINAPDVAQTQSNELLIMK